VLAEVRVVHGVALQQADQHRRAFLGVVAHTGLLAEDFGGADPGATAAEDVGREDFLRGALHVVVWMLRMNDGMSISLGHAFTHGAS
jgi:hypothetical protein